MMLEPITIRVSEGKRVGDTIGGRKIISLGKPRTVRVTDDTACVYGMAPGLDSYPTIQVQSAYVEWGQ